MPLRRRRRRRFDDDDGRLLRKLDIPSNQILECRPGIALLVSECVSVRECLWVLLLLDLRVDARLETWRSASDPATD